MLARVCRHAAGSEVVGTVHFDLPRTYVSEVYKVDLYLLEERRCKYV